VDITENALFGHVSEDPTPIPCIIYRTDADTQGRAGFTGSATTYDLSGAGSFLEVHCGPELQWFLIELHGRFTGGVFVQRPGPITPWISYPCIVNSDLSMFPGPGVYAIGVRGHEKFRIRNTGSASSIQLHVTRFIPEHPIDHDLNPDGIMEHLMLPRTRINAQGERELQHFLSVMNLQPTDVLVMHMDDSEADVASTVAQGLLDYMQVSNLCLILTNDVRIESLSEEDMGQLGWYRGPSPSDPLTVESFRLLGWQPIPAIDRELTEAMETYSPDGIIITPPGTRIHVVAPPEEPETLETFLDRDEVMVGVRTLTHAFLRNEISELEWRQRLASVALPTLNLAETAEPLQAMDRVASVRVEQED
jgi:hypothetical protein